ncbi:hypothetical protein BP5796_06353 [Coleophoma crateriformis]|uniref:Copper acquisition factor BIM1-like domain-containing protein n=1 Tax=Coleophoma crateriformis TaxID=565419 RepID=A0A3D8RXG2_9HELO|nr:hypothetical protein BP5796_06353 [Coleophoma crateriformis]
MSEEDTALAETRAFEQISSAGSSLAADASSCSPSSPLCAVLQPARKKSPPTDILRTTAAFIGESSWDGEDSSPSCAVGAPFASGSGMWAALGGREHVQTVNMSAASEAIRATALAVILFSLFSISLKFDPELRLYFARLLPNPVSTSCFTKTSKDHTSPSHTHNGVVTPSQPGRPNTSIHASTLPLQARPLLTWEPGANVNQTASTNRTVWPLKGGSLELDLHHPWTYIFVNLGLGTDYPIFNISLTPQFLNETGNGTLCLPQIVLPASVTPIDGQNASIQVVTFGATGSALYNCADITFSSTATALSSDTCANSSNVAVSYVNQEINGSTTTSSGAASSSTAASAADLSVNARSVSSIGLLAIAASVAGSWLL